ncbi:MAG: biopolymer transporter ExbD [Gammaproteobacteria bacterium]|jgi:biopolymer transport protein ExbD|nr:biopolymer transporter ExbD [Gammaproteobacteria bacterium]MBU2179763.1 biopolymer transporter ExbD [Gammaproteobacteria bacterium]MBU2224207.1 biopolymer transporter ExbD [Gammaproteobacteria bacterium]MBU2277771.1 biopolymer transporter ExbD [Gammaproteobacteria bacterium]MBU2428899.1 biopolymer transporter ExbD [Gammaproteobacteria bacterium]
MARKRIREDEEAAVDLTPMLDVVFIMLIFFIVTTSFVKEAGIDVNKPKAAQAQKKPTATIFIAIRPNGEIHMDKRIVDIERVSATIEKLLAESPTDTVIIQADREAKHGVVVKVMDQIKAAGIDKISIAADTGA